MARAKTIKQRKREGRDPLGVEIGERIARARSAAGLTTVASLHKRTREVDPESKGISQPVLLGYESGGYRPGARELKLLCLAMGVSPTWLLFGEENRLKDAPSVAPVALSFAEMVSITEEQKRGALLGMLFGYMTKQERDSWIAVIELFLRSKLGDKQFEMRQLALKAVTDLITSQESGLFAKIEKIFTEHFTPEQLAKFGEEVKKTLDDAGKSLSE